MGRYGDLDYARLTKRSVLLGAVLLAIGVLGEFVGHAYFAPLPAWENHLLFDMEVIGTLVFVLSPFVFGIAMPLTE